MRPVTETHQGVRTVKRRVPVTTMRTVTEDHGRYECVAVEVGQDACGGCASGCGTCGVPACGPRHTYRRVYVPNLVTREVPVTTYKVQEIEQPYNYTTTRCVAETKTRTVPVTRYRPEQRTRMVNVMRCRSEERTREFTVTRYAFETRTRQLPVTRTRIETQTRQVPVTRYELQTRTRQVPVTRMVHKQRTTTVPVTRLVHEVRRRVVPKVSYRTETRTRTVNVKTCRYVTETVSENYLVRVPVRREKEVQVRVCKMVPTEVRVPTCGSCLSCN